MLKLPGHLLNRLVFPLQSLVSAEVKIRICIAGFYLVSHDISVFIFRRFRSETQYDPVPQDQRVVYSGNYNPCCRYKNAGY